MGYLTSRCIFSVSVDLCGEASVNAYNSKPRIIPEKALASEMCP